MSVGYPQSRDRGALAGDRSNAPHLIGWLRPVHVSGRGGLITWIADDIMAVLTARPG